MTKESDNRHFLGIDVGTGSARAGVFDRFGLLLASDSATVELWREAGDVVEHSSEDIWRAVCRSVRGAVAQSGVAPDSIAGIGFDATCSLVVLGEGGAPLPVGPSGDPARDVIVWMDHRAADQARRINQTSESVLDYIGGTHPRWRRRNCCGLPKTCQTRSPVRGSSWTWCDGELVPLHLFVP